MRAFLIYWALLAALYAAALDTPVIRWEEQTVVPVAAETGFVRRLDLSEPARKAEDGSFAALAGRPGVAYEWMPTPDDSRLTKGAMLLDAALAPDGSALVFLERLGEKEGPFGSRIVVFDLLGNSVVAAPAFLKRQFRRVLPVSGSAAKVVALETRRDGEHLVLVDLATGSVEAESGAFAAGEGDLRLAGDKVYLLPERTAELLIFDCGNPAEAPERVALERAGGVLFVGDGGLEFAQATTGRVDFFRLQEGDALYGQRVALGGEFVPVFGAAAGAPGKGLLLGNGEGDGWIVFPTGGRKLDAPFGRAAVWVPEEKRFALNLLRNDALVLCSSTMPPELDRPVDVGRLKPATHGDVRWIFPVNSQDRALWVVDHRSNVFRVEMQGRRWKKTILRQIP